MGDKLIMSQKERNRKVILELVSQARITLVKAAELLQISYRQCKRIWKKYKEEGDAGLIHKSRGRSSNRAYRDDFKNRVLDLYQEKYMNFGPTFTKEKLLELDNIKISEETLRQWLLKAGLWHKKRKRKEHRQRRTRRAQFGELLQIDGSIHDWFNNGKKDCLLNIVDDATGTTLSQLDTGETTKVLFKTLWLWISRYGVPQAVYVDLKSLYISPKALKAAETENDWSKDENLSAFQRVCLRLNIKIIKAYSPEAKGRVERNHGVYQDRFVKELQLAKINTIGMANEFLLNSYLPKINNKFAKIPSNEIDGHRELKDYDSLKEIFCWEYTRQVQKNYVVQLNSVFYQLLKKQPIRILAKNKVTVRVYLDNSVGIWMGEHMLNIEKIADKPIKVEEKKVKQYTSAQRSKNAVKSKSKTPWSIFNPNWLKARAKFKALEEAISE